MNYLTINIDLRDAKLASECILDDRYLSNKLTRTYSDVWYFENDDPDLIEDVEIAIIEALDNGNINYEIKKQLEVD